tara:strand:+ start:62 stop:535 length:474 start_codon:yes stop_codon:yes gene_type:complete
MTLDKNQKELLESIDRVYATVAADKKADRIEKQIAKKFQEGKMDKPPKDTKNPGKGGKGNITLERETITIGDKIFMKNADGVFEEVMKQKNGGSVISMKEGGVPAEYKGFSKLPEAVQQKMDPELAKKYKKGGSVNKKTGIKRRITIKGMGIAKRGF